MAKAIHAMIRVLNEEKSVNFYKTAFDLNIAERLDFDSFTLVYLSNSENDFELELTVNKDRNTAYEHSDGYGHIAFCVSDLDATYSKFINAGLSPKKIVEFNGGGKMLARFFFVQDPDGYQIEVLQRHGRYK